MKNLITKTNLLATSFISIAGTYAPVNYDNCVISELHRTCEMGLSRTPENPRIPPQHITMTIEVSSATATSFDTLDFLNTYGAK